MGKHSRKHHSKLPDINLKAEYFSGELSEGMKLFQKFYYEYGHHHHQISTFNDFLINGLSQLFSTLTPLKITADDGYLQIRFAEPYVRLPGRWISGDYKLTSPNECMRDAISYTSDLLLDIIIEKHKSDNKQPEIITYKHQKLGVLPIMVGSDFCNTKRMTPSESNECVYSRGGYFVINGNRKVIISQEKVSWNTVLCFPGKKSVLSKCEIRTRKEFYGQTMVSLNLQANQSLVVKADYLSHQVPLNVLLELFGIDIFPSLNGSTFNLMDYLYSFNWIRADGKDMKHDLERILDINLKEFSIGENIITFIAPAENLTDKERINRFIINYLPHVITGSYEKGIVTCNMVLELLQYHLGISKASDRDNASNKRIETAGSLMYQLIRRCITNMQNELIRYYMGTGVGAKKQLKTVNNVSIPDRIADKQIGRPILSAMGRGDWSVGSDSIVGTGTCQSQQLYSTQILSNTRQVAVPITKGGKQMKQRELHPSNLGIKCPADTPEGARCGLVTNFALGIIISLEENHHPILEILNKECVLGYFNHNDTIIYVNNTPICTSEFSEKIYKKLRKMKLSGQISIYTGIIHLPAKKCLHVKTLQGRVLRPLLLTRDVIVNEGNFSQLARNGLVEFVEPMESETLLIAQNIDQFRKNMEFTHCEIHPAMLFGVAASTVPYPDHNQSPRNTYQSAMVKQVSGLISTAFLREAFTKQNIAGIMQIPLCESDVMKIMGYDKMPAGLNLTVAIANYGGSNQEDSIIMARDFIEKGGFSAIILNVYILKRKTQLRYDDNGLVANPMNHRLPHLNPDGLPKVGCVLFNNEVVIGEPDRLSSIKIKTVTQQIVESVEVISHSDGPMARVVTRENRIPIMGDKFCFSFNHEILTSKGWCPIYNVDMDDKIATMNKQGVLIYEKPISIASFYNDENLVNIISKSVNFTVTGNHNMYIRNHENYILKRVDELFGRESEYVKIAHSAMNNYSDEIMILSDFYVCLLASFIFNRGWVYTSDSICMNKTREILEIFIKYGKKYTESHAVVYYTDDVFVKNIYKYIPKLRDLPTRQMRLCLWPYMNIWHQDISTEYKDLFMILALHAGLYCDAEQEVNPFNDAKVWNIKFSNKTAIVHAGQQYWIGHDAIPYIEDREIRDKVYCCTMDPNTLGVIYVRKMAMEPGDFETPAWIGNSARHGQKGVIGAIIPTVDMPINSKGQRPDIIINPQAIPSRMTIAMLIECVLSTLCAETGKFGNSTPFEIMAPGKTNEMLKLMGEDLRKMSKTPTCEQMLINGQTGEIMDGSIFMGQIFYQRLKHMTLDKIQARSKGPRQALTRQPVEGRSREGGTRWGEMERDCAIGMGASQVTLERYMKMSDEYSTSICTQCGILGTVVRITKYHICESCKKAGEDANPDCTECREKISMNCRNCNTSKGITDITMPYATKLLTQELMGMGVFVQYDYN